MIPIRDATPEDAPALARILGAWVQDTRWMPKLHSPEDDLGFISGLISTGTVRIAGVVPLGFLARRGADILQLQIAAGSQRQGLGRALVKDAQGKAAHLSLWTHQANLPAQAFWVALGFVETLRSDGRDSEERLPDVRFEWSAP